MTQIVAVCNQKGGVGKTTVTINLGAALAHLDQKVLLIDLDPQGHLTEGVGMQDVYLNATRTLYDCLIGTEDGKLATLLEKHPTEPFSVIPSSYALMLAEQKLYMTRNREHKLKGLLSQLENHFDWILIDCPPVLGNLTDNALNAARQVVIPIQAEATSVRALDLLFDQIESVERGLNIQIRILAVVPNLVQDSAMSKRILTKLKGSVPMVTPFEMRKRVMLQAAWSAGCSIFAYPVPSKADEHTKQEIMEHYQERAKLVMERVAEGGTHG
jgi:chromosome partitioning protein